MFNFLYKKADETNLKAVVIESTRGVNKSALKDYIKRSVPVYVIEPFVAYHIRKGPFHGFSGSFPNYINELLQKNEIKLIPANSIDGKSIYRQAADKAVDVIESVYPEHRKEHRELFEYVAKTLKSSLADNIFKKKLCDDLADFYSVNILLHRIEKLLASGPILVYPDTNVSHYLHLKTLLSKSKQEFLEHPGIIFSAQSHNKSFFDNLKQYIIVMFRLTAQTLASGLSGNLRKAIKTNKKHYSYGITIISPLRQLTDNQRGPDFIVDNDRIKADDIVYLPITDLTSTQKKQLERMPGEVYYPPRASRCFSHYSCWKGLLRIALNKDLFLKVSEINTACSAFISYFRWILVMEHIEFKHLITHCDFGINHIGRNLALNQAGIETWYFSDSMNHGCNMKAVNDKLNMRHPFWIYLQYNHFVTWNELLAQYFKSHPGSFEHTHVVGCLWGEHIKENRNEAQEMAWLSSNQVEGSLIITAFDSTYSRNGFTSYAEGVVFAKHLLRLADDCEKVVIVLKEKKPRHMHIMLDPVNGPVLLDLYKKMDLHPGITTCSANEDSSALISVSDMVVSFPYTSTTFEALSVHKPAVWHDPLGYYTDTPYAKAGGVTTHSYDELKSKVAEIQSINLDTYQSPIHIDSPLMDPYCDGKAIDRFRELLLSN